MLRCAVRFGHVGNNIKFAVLLIPSRDECQVAIGAIALPSIGRCASAANLIKMNGVGIAIAFCHLESRYMRGGVVH